MMLVPNNSIIQLQTSVWCIPMAVVAIELAIFTGKKM
jgi:hypothetical protein